MISVLQLTILLICLLLITSDWWNLGLLISK